MSKPPMVLYFRENISTVHMDGSHMNNRFGNAFANQKRDSDVGPYVHLDQFLEEVEKRATLHNFPHCTNDAELKYWAFQQLTREIKGES